jgi:hypothetical protein
VDAECLSTAPFFSLADCDPKQELKVRRSRRSSKALFGKNDLTPDYSLDYFDYFPD